MQRLPISFLETEIIDNLLKELGYEYVIPENKMASKSSDSDLLGNYNVNSFDSFSAVPPANPTFNSEYMDTNETNFDYSNKKSSSSDSILLDLGQQESKHQTTNSVNHVWDFQGEHGGELIPCGGKAIY